MKDKNIKSIIFIMMEKIFPDKAFDFLCSKYSIWNIKRNSTEVSADAYYIRNKNGLKKPNYYIFRFGFGQGLFLVANKMLFYYEWAVANNYIPLIDVGFSDDLIQGKFGLNNLWEYCFQQPKSINDAFCEGNVLVSAINGGDVLRSTCKEINGNARDWRVHAKIQEWREYYAKLNQISRKIWIFKPEIKAKIESTQQKLFHPGMCVLGVVLREEFGRDDKEMTEAQRILYKKHPKALSLEETYKLILEYMTKWNCTHVLITTMFQESIEYFKEKLGSKVIYIERERRNFYDFNKKNARTAEEIVNNNGEKYSENLREHAGWSKQRHEQTAIGYAVEMATIAKCDYCMGVKCSGLIAACILNGGTFKDLYIFEDSNNIQDY